MKAKRYGHLDENHTQIAKALRDAGYSVGETSASAGFVDLVVSSRQLTVIAEIKTDDGSFTLRQLDFIAKWKGAVCFFTSPEQALDAMKYHKFLTTSQKEKILDFVYRKFLVMQGDNPKIRVKQFEKEIGF